MFLVGHLTEKYLEKHYTHTEQKRNTSKESKKERLPYSAKKYDFHREKKVRLPYSAKK